MPAIGRLAKLTSPKPEVRCCVVRETFNRNTDRLTLREFVPEDAEPLFRLNSDPEVLRYTGDRPFPDVSDALRYIESYDHYERHGFGRWAVLSRDDGKFIGFCGLQRDPESGAVDLAFRFFRRVWASGYATEASLACMQAGFRNFELNEIIGKALRENLPSISVLQKVGMRFRHMAEDEGVFWLVYGIQRDHFETRNTVE